MLGDEDWMPSHRCLPAMVVGQGRGQVVRNEVTRPAVQEDVHPRLVQVTACECRGGQIVSSSTAA